VINKCLSFRTECDCGISLLIASMINVARLHFIAAIHTCWRGRRWRTWTQLNVGNPINTQQTALD